MDDIGRRRADAPALSLRDAIRAARVDAAEQAGVVVELRDAELARLAMLNEMLEPVFAEVPVEHADLFDRGLMPGETPRLFVDMVAHIAMGRDRRTYRFLQDSRSGRRVLAESANPTDIVDAVTRYVARRLIAREQVLTSFASEAEAVAPLPMPKMAGRRPMALASEEQAIAPASRGGTILVFLAGLIAGVVLLLGFGLIFSAK